MNYADQLFQFVFSSVQSSGTLKPSKEKRKKARQILHKHGYGNGSCLRCSLSCAAATMNDARDRSVAGLGKSIINKIWFNFDFWIPDGFAAPHHKSRCLQHLQSAGCKPPHHKSRCLTPLCKKGSGANSCDSLAVQR